MIIDRKSVFIYVGTWIVSIVLLLLLSNQDFALDKDYKIRATDFSVIWYSCFLFLIPLFLKIAIQNINQTKQFTKLFAIQFSIAVVNVVTAVIILLDQNAVKGKSENYAFDKSSDIYRFYAIFKIGAYLSIAILFLLLAIQIVRKITLKKHSQ